MEKRNLIIGGFTNYGINQLKPWVLSAKEVAEHNTDIVLVYGNTSQETLDWLTEQGVLLWPMVQQQGIPPHVMRFHSLYDFMSHKWEEYEHVVATDVKDVYFQMDPTNYVEYKCSGQGGFDLVVASEGLLYEDEPWGNENLFQAYGPYVYNLFKQNEIFNFFVYSKELNLALDTAQVSTFNFNGPQDMLHFLFPKTILLENFVNTGNTGSPLFKKINDDYVTMVI